MSTRSWRDAEQRLDFAAVCLIGSRKPMPMEIGSNRVMTPVDVVWSRTPEEAPKVKDRAWPAGQCELLDHVWTEGVEHAKRLKDAVIQRILGDDAEIVRLRHTWLDLPDWEIAFPLLVQDALSDIRDRGERVEIFSPRDRIQRILKAAHNGI